MKLRKIRDVWVRTRRDGSHTGHRTLLHAILGITSPSLTGFIAASLPIDEILKGENNHVE